MTKYLVLYRATASADEQISNATPEEAQAGIDAWNSWGERAGSSIVDFGSPLRSVDVLGAGSSSGSANLGGFSIMEADSASDLRTLLEGHPHLMLDGAAIEVYEFLDLPGMS
ncbi:hypothetical protein ACFWN7_01120 [Agromyces sp. NPDC058484]|uniref:hypothetical protein n=1 Tax=Agromyces sp. NPDC058484 TaxID=3346524 RepID=UPI003659B648